MLLIDQWSKRTYSRKSDMQSASRDGGAFCASARSRKSFFFLGNCDARKRVASGKYTK